jgi:hypothetical protein
VRQEGVGGQEAIMEQETEDEGGAVATIMQALQDNKLFVNPKKTKLFTTEI